MSATKNNVFNILPFNPKSDIYDSQTVDITPEMAQYILDYHNKDNRQISKTQVNKIFRSIENDNWLLDGQPMTFNIDGNLTEFQHRLCAIAKCPKDRKFTVIVVTGVQRECFTKTATNKARKPIDEIQRKYRKAHSDEVSVLGDILKRRKVDRLSMQNAIVSYENWCKNVKNSIDTSGDFENVLDKYSLQRKTLRAWIALCERHGYIDECKTFLQILDSDLEPDSENDVTLAVQFNAFFKEHVAELSNEKRMDCFYAMLCIATDRIIMRDDGMIDFNVTSKELEHHKMRNQGVYRKFLG